MGIQVNKLQIALVGRNNVGKSRLINCIFNPEKFNSNNTAPQKTGKTPKSVISLPNGTPVRIGTISIDDNSEFLLTHKSLSDLDFFIIVLDAREELFKCETELITHLQNNHIPFLVAVNKIEFGTNPHLLSELDALEVTYFELSCKENAGIESFRKKLIHMLPDEEQF